MPIMDQFMNLNEMLLEIEPNDLEKRLSGENFVHVTVKGKELNAANAYWYVGAW